MTETELTNLVTQARKQLDAEGLSFFLAVHATTDTEKTSSRVAVEVGKGQSANMLQTVWRALGVFFMSKYEHPISDVSKHFGAGSDVAECVMQTMVAQQAAQAQAGSATANDEVH